MDSRGSAAPPLLLQHSFLELHVQILTSVNISFDPPGPSHDEVPGTAHPLSCILCC